MSWQRVLFAVIRIALTLVGIYGVVFGLYLMSVAWFVGPHLSIVLSLMHVVVGLAAAYGVYLLRRK